MPRSKDTTQLNIGIPLALATTVETLAQRDEHQGSKSHFVETCIRAYIEEAGSMGALDSVHERLSTLSAEVGKALQGVQADVSTGLTQLAVSVQTLTTQVETLSRQLTTLTATLKSNHSDLQSAYDSLSGRTAGPKRRGWFG